MPRREKTCPLCHDKFQQGYGIGLLVSSTGSLPRRQKYQPVMEICQPCGNAPGGRRRRWGLWPALRVALGQAIALVANAREVLTLAKNDESSILTSAPVCASARQTKVS